MRKLKLCACGFEPQDNPIWGNAVEEDKFQIEFIEAGETTHRFDSYDGVIIKSGAFEKISWRQSFNDCDLVHEFDEDLTLERQKQLSNLLQRGKWFCFFTGEIIDSVNDGPYSREISLKNTDLCKRVLNQFGINRRPIQATDVLCVADEFKIFSEKFGIGKTHFLRVGKEFNSLIKSKGGETLGFEKMSQVFFLPFHIACPTLSDIQQAVSLAANAIIDYKQKNLLETPPWLQEIEFSSEVELRKREKELVAQTKEIRQEIGVWENRKAVLSTSGHHLVKVVEELLTNFWGLNVDPKDEGREDLKILDDEGKPICFVEIKGTKKGIQRRYINQVDSNRELRGYSHNFPAMLIINDNMGLEGISKRRERQVTADSTILAQNHNVTLLRTVDLIELMKSNEKMPIAERSKAFMKLFNPSVKTENLDNEKCETEND